MEPTVRNARIAGFCYLLLMTAPFSLIYVPNKLIVKGNAAATAINIRAHEMMYRLSIVNELYGMIVIIIVTLALYRLLSSVSRPAAVLMVILGSIVTTPMACLNLVSEIAALTLLRGPAYLTVFSKQQLEALALFFVGLHGNGILVQEIFWGLWLFPFGYLIYRSGFIPRILGVLLFINGLTYVVVSLTGLLFPPYLAAVNRWAVIPETGELWIMLWLLIVGVKVRKVPAPSPALA